MMRKSLILGFVVLLIGCKGETPTPSADHMILDTVVYVDQFPKRFYLKDAVPLQQEVLGAVSLTIQDSLLIVSSAGAHDGYWTFFSLPECKPLGRYIQQGNGPHEFVTSPWVGQQQFFRENGKLFALIYDFSRGRFHKMDISESLHQQKTIMTLTRDSAVPALFGWARLDSATLLCKEVNAQHTQQIRYILDRGVRHSSDPLDQLNQATLRVGGDINILSTSTKCNPEGTRIIESAVTLHQLNLYAVDGSFRKTLCLSPAVESIEALQNQEAPQRKYTYMNTCVYSDFFSALYLD